MERCLQSMSQREDYGELLMTIRKNSNHTSIHYPLVSAICCVMAMDVEDSANAACLKMRRMETFQCKLCPKSYKHRQSLYNHSKIKHRRNEDITNIMEWMRLVVRVHVRGVDLSVVLTVKWIQKWRNYWREVVSAQGDNA
ncbi:hypothetical protein CAPTEDRAFT_192785, partial [Capitella teleta]